jgi:hypothetical protein
VENVIPVALAQAQSADENSSNLLALLLAVIPLVSILIETARKWPSRAPAPSSLALIRIPAGATPYLQESPALRVMRRLFKPIPVLLAYAVAFGLGLRLKGTYVDPIGFTHEESLASNQPWFVPGVILGVLLLYASISWALRKTVFKAPPNDGVTRRILVEGDRSEISLDCERALRAVRARTRMLDLDMGLIMARRGSRPTDAAISFNLAQETGSNRHWLTVTCSSDEPTWASRGRNKTIVMRALETLVGRRVYQDPDDPASKTTSSDDSSEKPSWDTP